MAAGLGSVLFVVLGYIAVNMKWPTQPLAEPMSSIEPLGNALLQKYLLPFEVASVLLLAVMIGAVIIVRKEVRPEAD